MIAKSPRFTVAEACQNRSRRWSRAIEWLVGIAVWVGVTSFRWLTIDFDNDYFMHVAWATEVLRGQLPVRDFVEPGFPLQTLISFASMKLFGVQIAVEGFVACAFVGLGSVCTYRVCRMLGAARGLSLLAAITAALAYPRLYAYPKVFAYPAALLAIAAYVKSPRRLTLALTATMTSVAFLFRHDHGIWIAFVALIAFALAHRSDWRLASRSMAQFAALTGMFTSPWLLWVMMSGYGEQYVRTLGGQGVDAVGDWRLPDRKFAFDATAPLLTMLPIRYPEVGIRWHEETTNDVRRDREIRYRLAPVATSADAYQLEDVSPENVIALLRDPVVHDTRGIDRQTARVPSGGFSWATQQVYQAVPLLRLRILPGVIRAENALPWLTYATFVLPWLLLVHAAWRTWRSARSLEPDAIIAVAAGVMAIIAYQRLVRGSPDSRIGDVAPLTAIIGAYLTTHIWRVRGRWRWISRMTISVAALVTACSALGYGRVGTRLEVAGIDGPTNMLRRAHGLYTSYRGRPLDVFAPPDATGLPLLARWLNACTEPEQRVAVIGFEPQLNVWAERGFAGGLAYFNLGWMSDPRDQRIALTRWRGQDVPFALMMAAEADAFPNNYAVVSKWLDERYVAVAQSEFGGNKPVTVYIERGRIAANTHEATGLPCLVPAPTKPPSLLVTAQSVESRE
jgi:hypothetical protein